MHDNTYNSLAQAIDDLTRRGFTYSFDINENQLSCSLLKKRFNATDLHIVESHRFEGPSSPDDSSVVYAIEAVSGEKGILIDAYGAYADSEKTQFILSILKV
jgi:hypothetical protein